VHQPGLLHGRLPGRRTQPELARCWLTRCWLAKRWLARVSGRGVGKAAGKGPGMSWPSLNRQDAAL